MLRVRIYLTNNWYILFYLLILTTSLVHSQSQYITADKASKYVGQEKTVRGIVMTATYAQSSKGQPTFLSLDKAYPEQVFTVVI